MDLSVVVPVRNEMGNISPLLQEIHTVLENRPDRALSFEVIYVNDGSTDETPVRLTAAQERWPRLRVLTHSRRAGQSRAVINGIRRARGEFIFTLDGDRQNDPASFEPMWQKLCESGKPDPKLVICGWRQNRKDTRFKRFASRIANGIRSRALGDRTPDSGCGLKIFSREAFLALPAFDHMHRFLPALFRRQGLEVVSVPVHHRPREIGNSNYGIWDRLWAGIWDLMGVAWLLKRSRYAPPELVSRADSSVTAEAETERARTMAGGA